MMKILRTYVTQSMNPCFVVEKYFIDNTRVIVCAG